mmetsp:Transcript_43710/g.52855  ORF Transcript_43710/g.52855 Transcript_43710/m.52855 type:complete len:257 (-) Transcript_43710:351-1121(-)|eukprot:CAMPEP_0197863856 /NCGR_PEP_ID=MMETSP1438-20131217/41620_1 /TAXON_ID=1461541 /ORGANISM="Pterosperma sp., Strain CCMP1384" /LENGTH=256 /DNA_ID=CAMNT_0043481897 /DNA_START=298 /DNA_END=1068 /DNA_ORIENTATION=+
MGRLEGKVAVVTGASSGIGAGIALALAAEGAKVALAARNVDNLNAVKTKIEGAGGTALAVSTDVVKREDCKALVKATEDTFGPVDIMVNCAGVMYFTLMKNLHEDEWEKTIDVNCKGVVNGCGAVIKSMTDRDTGHIVNISSDAGRDVWASLTVYSASKHFVWAISKGLRKELIGTGVRVTDIQPGDVKTNLIMNNTDKEAAEQMGVTIGAEVGTGAKRTQVLDPEDIASAVIYAVTAPPHVGVHEMMVEPKDQEG